MDLFTPEPNGDKASQSILKLDDGSGLRVVNARFVSERQFDWSLFEGYDQLRVLTYSASVNAIVRMLDNYSFNSFECVFGYEGTLRDIKNILAFQKVVVGDTRAAIMGLKDDRHVHILEKVHAGQARFRVLRKAIAHAKIYLLSNADGRNRVIVGSANLSEQAFSGRQSETLVFFDDDEEAWAHYNRMYQTIRDSASDEIKLPEDRITKAEIEIPDTPVLSDISGTLIIEAPKPAESHTTMPVQIQRVEKVAAVLGPALVRGGPRHQQRHPKNHSQGEAGDKPHQASQVRGGSRQPLLFHRQDQPHRLAVRRTLPPGMGSPTS